MIKNQDHLIEHLRSGKKYTTPPILVQEFIPGYDADLSILSEEGEVFAYILQSRKNPHAFEFIENKKALSIIQNIAKETKYSGVANFDIRINESTNEITVLECNPRFWFTLSASLWRGINFVELGLALAQQESLTSHTISGGNYYRHGHLLKKILWNPLLWSSVKRYNIQGLWQVISDPVPILAQAIRP